MTETVTERTFLFMGGHPFTLTPGRSFTIGRDPSCDLCLNDGGVSRTHACVQKRGGRFFLEDAGSTNGTFLNGSRIRHAEPLVEGDVVRIHVYSMRFSKTAPKETGSKAARFGGDLAAIGVADVLQFLHISGRTGLLHLENDGNRADFSLKDGNIVSGRCETFEGDEALFAILRWRRGRFSFLPDAPLQTGGSISRPTPALLLEGCRLLDEQEAAQS